MLSRTIVVAGLSLQAEYKIDKYSEQPVEFSSLVVVGTSVDVLESMQHLHVQTQDGHVPVLSVINGLLLQESAKCLH